MKTHFVFSQLVPASLSACITREIKTPTGDCSNIHYTYKAAYPHKSSLIAVEKIRLISSLLFGFDVSQGHKAVFPIIGRTCFVCPDDY
jgi:hypothetical protein